ncbi:MAG: PD40 domain-containing protein, partial [Chloroflexi bacterium]|nr:PD40 domain-containing protein [Chloroflexota bacterium]
MKKHPVVLLAVLWLLVGCQFRPIVPTRTQIAFMTDRDGDFEIYLMERDGSRLVNLTQNKGNDGVPIWSSQARAFSFITTRDGENRLSIYRMDVKGENQTTLTPDLAVDGVPPTWSPTGEWVAFGSGGEENPDVYLVDAMGKQVVNLTNNPAKDNFSTWSPDGRTVLFTSDRDGTINIYAVSVQGGEATALTGPDTANGRPAWSPDGQKIAFMSDRDGGDVE